MSFVQVLEVEVGKNVQEIFSELSSAKGTTETSAVALPLVIRTCKVFLISTLDYRIFPSVSTMEKLNQYYLLCS